MSGVFAARSTVSALIRLSTQFAAWGFVSVLLAETLRSSTFKRALIFIAVFGAIVFALLGYVYFSTASYIIKRLDRAIETDRAVLMAAYETSGHDGLIAAITKFVTDKRFEDSVVLLADPSFAPVAGNLWHWPPLLADRAGWRIFEA